MQPRTPTSVIDLDNIHLTLASLAGPVNILNGISLKLAESETLGIVGPSGSGKSSLMAIMTGLEKPSGGRVRVAGEELQDLGEDALALFRRHHIGIVLQAFHLIPTMTALENAAIPLELAGAHDAFARAEAELRAVGLGHRLNHYPAQLSGGEQQRVALARALAPKPQVLFADEPTGNLDRATGEIVIDMMFERNRRDGTTLVLITHDVALAARCHSIAHMADGRLTDIDAVSGSGQTTGTDDAC